MSSAPLYRWGNGGLGQFCRDPGPPLGAVALTGLGPSARLSRQGPGLLLHGPSPRLLPGLGFKTFKGTRDGPEGNSGQETPGRGLPTPSVLHQSGRQALEGRGLHWIRSLGKLRGLPEDEETAGPGQEDQGEGWLSGTLLRCGPRAAGRLGPTDTAISPWGAPGELPLYKAPCTRLPSPAQLLSPAEWVTSRLCTQSLLAL